MCMVAQDILVIALTNHSMVITCDTAGFPVQ